MCTRRNVELHVTMEKTQTGSAPRIDGTNSIQPVMDGDRFVFYN